MVSSTPRPHFIPGKAPVPIVQEAGWAPGPVLTGRKSRPNRDSISGPSSPFYGQYTLLFNEHQVPFPRVNCPGTKSDYSPLSNDEVKNERSYISVLPHALMLWTAAKLSLLFYLPNN